MRVIKFIIIALFCLSSCKSMKNELIGKWKLIKTNDTLPYGINCIVFEKEETPYYLIFNHDNTVQKLPGFINYDLEDKYFGTISDFNLLGDKVLLCDSSDEWNYKIQYLNEDSLFLVKKNGTFEIYQKVKRLEPETINHDYDMVISSFFESNNCPNYVLHITKDYKLLLKKNNTFNELSIEKIDELGLKNIIQQINPHELKSEYLSRSSETHLRKSSFIFLNEEDTIKSIISEGVYTPTELKYLLIVLDDIIIKL
jgi:hypothetical protein